jgi:ABC-2 type transport system ATP-binding protein
MQRAHEVLFYVGLGEGPLPQPRDLLHRHETADQARAGARARPDLLFLDEPTNGMDPKGREEMLALIADIARNKGLNVILSSHLLPDVEYTCDHVIVLDKGSWPRRGSIEGLKGRRERRGAALQG